MTIPFWIFYRLCRTQPKQMIWGPKNCKNGSWHSHLYYSLIQYFLNSFVLNESLGGCILPYKLVHLKLYHGPIKICAVCRQVLETNQHVYGFCHTQLKLNQLFLFCSLPLNPLLLYCVEACKYHGDKHELSVYHSIARTSA